MWGRRYVGYHPARDSWHYGRNLAGTQEVASYELEDGSTEGGEYRQGREAGDTRIRCIDRGAILRYT